MGEEEVSVQVLSRVGSHVQQRPPEGGGCSWPHSKVSCGGEDGQVEWEGIGWGGKWECQVLGPGLQFSFWRNLDKLLHRHDFALCAGIIIIIINFDFSRQGFPV